ncbi:flagellar biosynthesis protein FlhB [Parendozoicomonas haliclonae]|uniref:Flagellar biosynthetic protein FlhB n=1 Tax=Parendozoicomonas haliclonae TaxID=1960125 RepID=A0A1X7AQC4_9GAMM|nr:flagellar biosynthesis protein FlhB [Parendozoicomonas haliclonae]SMA49616.1 Flagellar biosynthetic protein FlhB [Parendozoicomonas haliclonae]
MADTSQDRTEEPTARKLQKSREQGQIPRSREIGSAVLIVFAGLLLQMYGLNIVDALMGIIRHNLSVDRLALFDTTYMLRHLSDSGIRAVLVVSPIPLALMLLAIGSSGLTGGFLFQTSLLEPKFNRLNPVSWFGRVFSLQGLVELGKSILKVVLVMGCLLVVLWQRYPLSLSLGRMPVNSAMATGVSILGWSLMAFGAVLFVIAAIDAPYQIWQNKQKLKMTKQEIKDEHKDIDGKPEVKGRIRQLQREMSMRRMMQRVPEADVIITNPTHYSVALKYDTDRASAPFVIAKGVDQVALKIREIARDSSKPVIEAPLLARAVYHSTKVDQEIPMDLYMAVAQVLAYVQQLSLYRKGQGGDTPPTMGKFDIPEVYDEDGHRKPGKGAEDETP